MLLKIKRVLPEGFKAPLRRLWSFFLRGVNSLSPVLATKILHWVNTGSWINFNRPKNFNEKLQWLKFNEDQLLRARCSDKYEVYGYIRDNYDPTILNNLISVHDDPNEIVWEHLPEKFVIKCTHGCGYNIIAKNKGELNKREVFRRLAAWMREDFSRRSLEYHYGLIKPRIIVEDYIEDGAGELPLDYKIYCFNGVPRLVLVCSERDESLRLDFFDLDWNKLAIGLEVNESTECIPKPKSFDDMVRHAAALAKPFVFVRIDFYDKDGIPIFGEFTFTPAGNMANYYNEYGLHWLGDLLDIGSS